jgi:hypothetical protein
MMLPMLSPLLLLAVAAAQDPPPKPAAEPAAVPAAPRKLQQPEKPHFVVRHYPQDRDVAIAVVGSHTLTLGDLVDHIDARHYPGFKLALPTRPEIQRLLQSDLVAPWVRHFADLEALQQTFGADVDPKRLEQAQSDALKSGFKGWLETYVHDLEKHGRPTELSTDQINSRLSRYQLENGLAIELQGFLDLLEPGDYSRGQLRNFFEANPRTFGGRVNIEHILIQHRDSGTGILLDDEGLGLANARLADIKARLRPDGSNFEEVAQRSDDQKTGREGGKLEGVYRYDDRLPAALCRAAWELKDGEISDVVETQYGWHIVKRIDYAQNVYILFTDDAMPTIKKVMRRAMQEERLFAARKKAGVRLLL